MNTGTLYEITVEFQHALVLADTDNMKRMAVVKRYVLREEW